MYERDWTVRFSDTDPFAIAHYPRIIDAVHETSDMFMEEIGYPLWDLSMDHGIGLPIVEIDVQFEQSVDAGDTVSIRVTPDLGERSVRFEYVGRCDGTDMFSGYEQRVCVPKGGDSAIALPDDLRRAMEKYAND
jgi:4-hydroxybenzoyl-CoA thioesterase